MTDLGKLDLPEACAARLKDTSRDERIVRHSVRVNAAWWETALQDHGLPGEVVVDDGETAEISRGTLFGLAEGVTESDEGAATLLWSSLAWGAGTSARNMGRRLTSLVADWDHAVKVLQEAARLSAECPSEAFRVFRPGSRNEFTWLGPAFFSKYLYFAGGGRPKHPSLILDARVAASLHAHGWDSLAISGNWPDYTYQRYCDLLARWADEGSSRVGRQVAADEIERWLFDQR